VKISDKAQEAGFRTAELIAQKKISFNCWGSYYAGLSYIMVKTKKNKKGKD